MIEYLVLTLIFLYFIIASFEDIKKREVYDYINFSLSFFLIIISIFHSILINSIDPIKYVGFGLLIGFSLGSALYYLGIWGGGDAKFLIGFSASSYYLLNFVHINSKYQMIFDYLSNNLSLGIDLFLKYTKTTILIVDILFVLIILFLIIFIVRERKRLKNLIMLLSILFILMIGLYFQYSPGVLIILGFISFILIFFADDEVFKVVYFLYKKNTKYLSEGNILDKNILIDSKEIISKEGMEFGLEKDDILSISTKVKRNHDVEVRKVLPYSILVGLNFIIYVIMTINLDKTNIDILFFQLNFLMISFLVGGIFTIGLIFYIFLRDYNKINLNISKNIKITLIISTFIITLLTIINIKFYLLYFLIITYLLFKIGKSAEKIMFVKKKKISKIVPGDWIVEDIKVNEKIIYSVDDFKLGINESQLEKIKLLSKNNLSLKSILVKDGIAFLPPLFVGFLILILI